MSDSRKKRVQCKKCNQIMNSNSIKNHYLNKHEEIDCKGIIFLDEIDDFWSKICQSRIHELGRNFKKIVGPGPVWSEISNFKENFVV